MEEKHGEQEKAIRNIAISAPMFGNFALDIVDRKAREAALGNFEAVKKDTHNEKDETL